MTISSYNIVYLITNIFGTYIIYRLMGIFFKRDNVKSKFEVISYSLYFIIISGIYLVISIPIVMLICNILAFFALSFNYRALLKSRIMAVVFMYMILMSIESIVAVLSGYFNFSVILPNNYSSIMGLVGVKILSYVVVLFIENCQNIKKGINIPNSYWLAIFLVPLGSLYIMISLFRSYTLALYEVVMCMVLLLFINFVMFYLYDVLSDSFEQKIEKLRLEQQNTYYIKQFDILKSSFANLKSVRHDLKNHLFIMESFIKRDDKKKVLDYISEIISKSYGEKEYVHSGNTNIDSILNFKSQEAEAKGIKMSLEIKVPPEINITAFDMVVVLGNLLDNAIYGAARAEKDKNINVQLTYKKGMLIMRVENTFDGFIQYEGDKIATSHKDKENHGMGLSNIEAILHKYDGTIEIRHTEDKFYVDTLMYVS